MIKQIFNKDIILALAIVGILFVMIIPLPPFALDIFLVLSITIALLIMLISIYAVKPLDFSVFPTILLFVTMFRLALNIASTRLILLHGADGENAAGTVISSFGDFVVGGNYVVGFIVFVILVIINFIVITKGAGRISEVAARFTLDAMPGKQLAIDADLNAGIISDIEAKTRRKSIEQESDFYGAMDGASKFVRGDAIAGLLITIINILAGFIIGIVQNDMTFLDALKVYTLLTVGDGLVTQIPALIVSTSSGVVVTKVVRDTSLQESIASQMFQRYKPMGIVAGLLFMLGIIPGLPTIPFFMIGIILGVYAWQGSQGKKKEEQSKELAESTHQADVAEMPGDADNVLPALDILRLEVGYDLIPMVDQRVGGTFLARILSIRKQFAQEMGVIVPSVHICDNLRLKSNEYQLLLKGAKVGGGDLLPHHCLAMSPGMTTRKIDGIETQDPTFGLPAIWIPEEKKEEAIVAGYTVVDLASVMATHLTEVIRKNLHNILNRQDLQALIDQFKEQYPKVVSELIPELLPFGVVLRVLQNLLKEDVPIRDLLTIFETLADVAPSIKDADTLTEHVRVALGRSITQLYMQPNGSLDALCLEKSLEEKLAASIHAHQGISQLIIDPNMAKAIIESIGSAMERNMNSAVPPVVLTSQIMRPHLRKLLEKFIPNLSVLSHGEVAGYASVKTLSMIGG